MKPTSGAGKDCCGFVDDPFTASELSSLGQQGLGVEVGIGVATNADGKLPL
jgi:hypothetical protein